MQTPSKLNDRSRSSLTPVPPVMHYLWAVGANAAQKSPGDRVGANRFQVSAPQIWIDTQPQQLPDVPEFFPDAVLPYLYLYPYRLHVPEVYGFCTDDKTGDEIVILDNVPLTQDGELQPSIVQAWQGATAVRQVYWLWQMLELWIPVWKLNVASSLLSPENLRVEGWRVRLTQLIPDQAEPIDRETASFANPTLANLAQCWLLLLDTAKPAIAEPLRAICAQMQAEDTEYPAIAEQLNRLLLEQAARLPLRLQVQGATDVGPLRSHNEDSCYPRNEGTRNAPPDELSPRLAIVCDGIGGHEGGEVASQLAVQTLKMQLSALLTELAEQPDLVPPELISEQLSATVRVVNNLICAQNDAQERTARQRMGTTLVMALQIPQRVKLPEGAIAANAHELYLVNVGDSRAYWMTPNGCHQLTIDDDVAVREVRMGRALYRESLRRPDAGALTQALGTRDSEYLHPSVQRFVLEEDGVLVLCSDGLSDNDLVEQSWAEYAQRVLINGDSLESAIDAWIKFANDRNGHDNTSIVLMQSQVSSAVSELKVTIAPPPVPSLELPEEPAAPQWEEMPEPAIEEKPRQKRIWLWSLLFLALSSAIGLGAWYKVNPTQVQQLYDRVSQPVKNHIPNTFLKR